eukprot:gene22923-29101_t
MHGPLSSDKQLYTYAKTLSWMRHPVTGAMEEKLTIKQFLIALCATVDNLTTFSLYNDDNVTVHSVNLLQLAIMHGSYIIVKTCMKKGKNFKRADVFANGINPLRIAVENNHAHVAEYILKCFTNKVIADFIPAFYAMTSSAGLCKRWRDAAVRIQKHLRRWIVRLTYKSDPSWKQFNAVWGPVVRELSKQRRLGAVQADSWAAVKRQFEIISSDFGEDDDISQLTDCVLKLEDGEDTVLGSGGFARNETLVFAKVWFVSKLDRVSHYLDLIDASCHRLTRELVCTQHNSEQVEASVLLGDNDVLIDPAGNCPLKSHQVQNSEVWGLLNSHFMTLSAFTVHIAALVAFDCGASATNFSSANNVQYYRFVNVILPDIRKNSGARDLSIFEWSDLIFTDFAPRDYQIEAFRLSLIHNLIVVIPTGAGKTLIAAMTMHRMKVLNPHRIAVMVVDRIPLAYQQAHAISEYTHMHLVAQVRDGAFDGIVITAGLLVELLQSSRLRLVDFCVLVLDECHHASGGHSYMKLLDQVALCPAVARPLLLGLTASPAQAPNVEKACRGVAEMQRDFLAQRCSGLKPTVVQKRLQLSLATTLYHQLVSLCDTGEVIAQNSTFTVESCNDSLKWQEYHGVAGAIFNNSEEKHAQQVAQNIKTIILDLHANYLMGPLLLEDVIKHGSHEDIVRHLKRGAAGDSLTSDELNTALLSCSSQLRELVKQLLKCSDTNKILVFVETRNNARMLNKILRVFLPFFNSTVVIGQQGFDGMLWNGQCGQKEALEQFAFGTCRLIVCTSVLEEGLDVPDCDCVFRFGGRTSLIQHIQRRGRARAKNTAGGRGKMVIIFTEEERVHLASTQHQESILDAALASVTARLGDMLSRSNLQTVEAGDSEVVSTMQSSSEDERTNQRKSRQYCLKMFVSANSPSLQQTIVNAIKGTTLVSSVNKVEVFEGEAQSHALASPNLFTASDSVVLVSISTNCGGDFLHRFSGVWDFRVLKRPASVSFASAPPPSIDWSDASIREILSVSVGHFITQDSYQKANELCCNYSNLAVSSHGGLQLNGMCPWTKYDVNVSSKVTTLGACVYVTVNRTKGTLTLYFVLRSPPIVTETRCDLLLGFMEDVHTERVAVTSKNTIDLERGAEIDLSLLSSCPVIAVTVCESQWAKLSTISEALGVPVMLTSIAQFDTSSEEVDLSEELKVTLQEMGTSADENSLSHCATLIVDHVQWTFGSLLSRAHLLPLHPRALRRILESIEVAAESGYSELLHAVVAMQQLLTLLPDAHQWKDAGQLFDDLLRVAQRTNLADKWRNDVAGLLDGVIPGGFEMTKRVAVTPSSIRILPSLPIKTSRLIRKYCKQFTFVFVYFVDEQDQPLFHKKILKERYKTMVQSGFDLHGEHYEFVACSNSQMKEKTCVFVLGNRSTVHHIRDGLLPRSFQQEKGDAKYLSRLGLFLTADRETINLHPSRVKTIPDEYICGASPQLTSDGSGRISRRLLQEICPQYVRDHGEVPQIIHLRYRGFKGIAVCDTSLDYTPYDLVVRPSMKKCDSDHTMFCVVKEATYNSVRLNREIINLLGSLAVGQTAWSPHSRIAELQDAELHRLNNMVLSQEVAVEYLSVYFKRNMLESLVGAGINVLQEPFWLSLLQTIYQKEVKALRKKTHIPLSTGCFLTAAPDPSGLLRDGEVFVQVQRGASSRVITGPVIMYRNPCLAPGDVRIVTAVDIPELRSQFKLSILFLPSGGRNITRSLSAECSGGDLDGDQFSIIWDEGLVPPKSLEVEAFDYAALGGTTTNNVPAPTEPAYIINNMTNGALGIIANVHLAVCDLLPLGAREELAQLIAIEQSKAVDFPKTGITPEIPEAAMKLVKEHGHPDFMEEKASYESDKTIGVLYRKVCAVSCDGLIGRDGNYFGRDELLLFQIDDISEANVHEVYEMFEVSVKSLMTRFDIRTMGELVLGEPYRWAAEFGGDQSKASEALKASWQALCVVYREKFVNLTDSCETSERYKYASAWYSVAYHDEKALHCFAWIIADVLVSMRLEVLSAMTAIQRDASLQGNGSVTRLIGVSALSTWKSKTVELSRVLHSKRAISERIQKSILKNVGNKLRPNILVEVYGSVALLLCDQDSDVDLFVSLKNKAHNTPADQLHFLNSHILAAADGDSKSIRNAETVPIIKLVVMEGDVATTVDICAKRDGVQKARFIRSLYTQDVLLLPVFACIKQWAQQCGIVSCSAIEDSGSKRAKLNSGQLQAMILSFLAKDGVEDGSGGVTCSDLELISRASCSCPQALGCRLVSFFAHYSSASLNEFTFSWPIESASRHSIDAADMQTIALLCQRASHCLAVRRDWQYLLSHCVVSDAASTTFTYTLSRAVSDIVFPNLEFFTQVLELESSAGVTMQLRNKMQNDTHIVIKGKGSCFQIHQLKSKIQALVRDGRAGTRGRLMARSSNYFMESSTLLCARHVDARSAMFGLQELHKHDLAIQRHHKLRAISRLVLKSSPCVDWADKFCTDFADKTICQLNAMRAMVIDTLSFAVHFGTFYMVDARQSFDRLRGAMSCSDIEQALVNG